MNNKKLKSIVYAASITFIALIQNPLMANKSTENESLEKCYGVVKKGMNDCQTKTASCATSATKDRQPDAFLFLPKGLCQKIVGGKLEPDEN